MCSNLPPLGADGAAAVARHRRDGGDSRAVASVVMDGACVSRPMEEEWLTEMDISLGKRGQIGTVTRSQRLHTGTPWAFGVCGGASLVPSSLSGKGQVGPPRIAQVGVLSEGRREVFTQPLLSLRMGLKSLSPLF